MSRQNTSTNNSGQFLVAFVSLCFGTTLAVIYEVLVTEADRKSRDAHLDACILMFTCAYLVGMLIYHLTGRTEEYRQLEAWSTWHVVLLTVFAGFFCSWDLPLLLQGVQLSPGRILFNCWGLFLLAIAVFRGFRAWKRTKTPEVYRDDTGERSCDGFGTRDSWEK